MIVDYFTDNNFGIQGEILNEIGAKEPKWDIILNFILKDLKPQKLVGKEKLNVHGKAVVESLV